MAVQEDLRVRDPVSFLLLSISTPASTTPFPSVYCSPANSISTTSLCNKDPDQKQMDAICNAFLGPEVRAKYKTAKPGKKTKPKKPKNKSKTKQKPGKLSKASFLAEVPRSQVEPGTELCGVNNALICRKTTAATITTPLTTPSPPRQTFTKRPQTRVITKAKPPQIPQTGVTTKARPPQTPQTRVTEKARPPQPVQTRVTPRAKPPQTPNPRLRPTFKPSSRKSRPAKSKSKSAKQNQIISSRSKGTKGKFR